MKTTQLDFGLIDSHQHVFWHGRDDAGLIADMDEHGIEKAWLLTWEEPYPGGAAGVLDPRFQHMGNASTCIPLHAVVEACRRYPDRFIAGYCPDPTDPNAIGKLLSAIDIWNVRILGEWKFQMLFDDPRCIELYRVAGEKGLPVVLHLGVPYLPPKGGKYVQGWKGGTIANLERALQACPDTMFIGHAPGFWRELAADADEIATSYLTAPIRPGGRLPGLFDKYSNLYADLSANSALRALEANRELARDLLIHYADRLLFGRDYYGGELLRFLESLELPKEVWKKIGRENAERLISKKG